MQCSPLGVVCVYLGVSVPAAEGNLLLGDVCVYHCICMLVWVKWELSLPVSLQSRKKGEDDNNGRVVSEGVFVVRPDECRET